ncbi:MAG: ABC transporter ATP-binding protein/permease [Defluviitaleaceae bacterium]|nr:ABC transporter ATP-binding protein/permease [Defluviitaleaceae bacterium]
MNEKGGTRRGSPREGEEVSQIKEPVPGYMKTAFQANGVAADKLIYAIHTDLTLEGDFSDVYVAVDNTHLHILYGLEEVVKVEGARRIVAQYTTHKAEAYPLIDIGELKTEKLLSTCRLISVVGETSEDNDDTSKDDNARKKLLMIFSLGLMGYVDRLIKVVKNIREGVDPMREVIVEDTLFCPKCATRYPEPDRKLCPKCTDKMSIFFRLLSFFRFYTGKVAAVFVVVLAITGLSILAPYVGTRMFVDEVLSPDGQWYRMVGTIVLFFMGIRLLNTGFEMLQGVVVGKIMPWIIYDLQMRIFEAMQRLSVGFYTSKRTGALMNRVSRDARNIYWFFVDGLPFIIINVATFIGVFIVMLLMEWRLALICISIIPALWLMYRLIMHVYRRYHHKFWVINSQMNNMVSDAVNGQRVIKAFAREGEEANRFANLGSKQVEVDVARNNLGFTAFPAIGMFRFLGQVVVTVVGGMMVINGEISLGMLLVFLSYLQMLAGPINFLATVSNWWARCMDAAQRVFEVVDAHADIVEPENPIHLPEMKGEIAVRDVWFQYDPATPVLKGMSLDVPAGQTLGIVGKTGAGKSTLANLIARLYDVNEGSVHVDGVDVKQLSLTELRTNIGIVSQEIYLFIGSIIENIRYARPEATLEEVIWAAKMASAHDFIVTLPDGYETRVGAGGQELSGGERQRLSIARTIIQNPKILILDEATAAMDTETESKIQTALNKLQTGRTTIAIAHRLSTLKDADMLAVINEGKVVETGTHEDLMRKKGEYHKLYSIQMEGLKVISMD